MPIIKTQTSLRLPLYASLLKYISFPPHWPMDRKRSTWCGLIWSSLSTYTDKLFSAGVKAHDNLSYVCWQSGDLKFSQVRRKPYLDQILITIRSTIHLNWYFFSTALPSLPSLQVSSIEPRKKRFYCKLKLYRTWHALFASLETALTFST